MAKAPTLIQKTDMLRDMQAASASPGNKSSNTEFYAFYVVNVETQEIEVQFGFDIPPQTIELDAEASAEAIALQEGNFYTDERGQYFRVLNMSGTFGFRPTKGRSSRIDRTGLQRSVSQIQQAGDVLRGDNIVGTPLIPRDERTGFDRQVDLENTFHFYWDKKKSRDTAGLYVFVYANWKMGEVWIAQPLRIRRTRTVPSDRFKHKYNLSLRLLAPLSVKGHPRDFLPQPNKDFNFYMDRARQAARVAEEKVGALREVVEGATSYAVQFPNQVLSTARTYSDVVNSGSDFVREVLDRTDEIVNVTTGTISGQVASSALNSMEAARNVVRRSLEAKGMWENLADNEIGKYRQLAMDVTRIARSVVDMLIYSFSGQEQNTVNDAAKSIGKFYRKPEERRALDVDRIPRGNTPLYDRGSKTSIGGRGIPEGSREVTLPGGSTIKNIASRFLGSAGRWKEIVTLNRLRPPYISPQGDGITVLRPGDFIKIPAIPEEDGDDNQIFNIRQVDAENSEARKYGRDLKANIDDLDILVDEYGDLATIEGLPNLRQAMHIKVKTRPGDLKVHPWFGFSGEVGTGLSIDRLARYQLEVRDTLLSDTRIDRVDSLSVRGSGDIISIRAVLIPKDNDDRVSIDTRSKLQ